MVIAVLGCVVLIALGVVSVLAYTGVYRSWARHWPLVFSRTFVFGAAYGLGGIVLLIFSQILKSRLPHVSLVLMTLGMVGAAIMVLSFAWLPPFLCPHWYREVSAEDRARARAADGGRRG